MPTANVKRVMNIQEVLSPQRWYHGSQTSANLSASDIATACRMTPPSIQLAQAKSGATNGRQLYARQALAQDSPQSVPLMEA